MLQSEYEARIICMSWEIPGMSKKQFVEDVLRPHKNSARLYPSMVQHLRRGTWCTRSEIIINSQVSPSTAAVTISANTSPQTFGMTGACRLLVTIMRTIFSGHLRRSGDLPKRLMSYNRWVMHNRALLAWRCNLIMYAVILHDPAGTRVRPSTACAIRGSGI